MKPSLQRCTRGEEERSLHVESGRHRRHAMPFFPGGTARGREGILDACRTRARSDVCEGLSQHADGLSGRGHEELRCISMHHCPSRLWSCEMDSILGILSPCMQRPAVRQGAGIPGVDTSKPGKTVVCRIPTIMACYALVREARMSRKQ